MLGLLLKTRHDITILISRPTHLDVNMDVFLEPLMEEMKKLWEEGVDKWDEFCKEPFTLKAMIFVTINDCPALFSLRGSSKERLVV